MQRGGGGTEGVQPGATEGPVGYRLGATRTETGCSQGVVGQRQGPRGKRREGGGGEWVTGGV